MFAIILPFGVGSAKIGVEAWAGSRALAGVGWSRVQGWESRVQGNFFH